MQPLAGIRVLDFSTLLPGPMATLLLADAGAEVIKIERPNGEEMRGYEPKIGADSVNFALLNRGKRSVTIDLKAAGAVERLKPLIASADVVVEQFRPGVMDRLGIGYEALNAINPRIIYCAITGFGQTGPKAQVAAHDLNYVAESGMLAIAAGSDAQAAEEGGGFADEFAALTGSGAEDEREAFGLMPGGEDGTGGGHGGFAPLPGAIEDDLFGVAGKDCGLLGVGVEAEAFADEGGGVQGVAEVAQVIHRGLGGRGRLGL